MSGGDFFGDSEEEKSDIEQDQPTKNNQIGVNF